LARIVFRPAVRADFERLAGCGPAARVRGFSAYLGDELLAVAGLVYKPDGIWASTLIAPHGRKCPAAIWRGGVKLVAMAQAAGIRTLLATAAASEPAAQRFLVRLGFRDLGIQDQDGKTIYVWNATGRSRPSSRQE
jgi:hypothetical protein